jgi:hypothetical protein
VPTDEKQENYGRAKETHSHTQQLWEKEIRRARKETFKVQSALVKVQDELKTCRAAQKAAEDGLQTEHDKTTAREQEAYDAQSKLVGLQEQLDQALGRVTMLEQELDAIKTLAKNEAEVRRLAVEDNEDEWAGPRKRARLSSDADPEVETLAMLWEWEKQRADRALDQVQFLEAECQLKTCSAGKALRQSSVSRRSSPRKRASMLISDAGDPMILSESRRASAEAKPTPRRSKTDILRVDKGSRRSTIFLAAEGIFRTVSQAEADAMGAKAVSPIVSPTESAPDQPITPSDNNPMYRRTPSVEPPDFAMPSKERTSLLSLLDAPHRQDPSPIFNIPTTPGPASAAHQPAPEDDVDAPATIRGTHLPPHDIAIPPREPATSLTAPLTDPLPSATTEAQPYNRPHTTASYYPPTKTTTTTTKVPLRSETSDGPTLAQRLMKMQQRTPSRQTGDGNGDGEGADGPSFDTTNPALTPTMTREEALAQIRERRDRARSVGRVGSGTSANGGNGNSGGSASNNGSTGEVRRKVSGGSATGEVRRKVSGQELRRKVSNGEIGTAGGRRVAGEDRGREREVRREVSAPTAATGGAVRRGVSGARRVRS